MVPLRTVCDQTTLAQNFEMSRCGRLVQPEFVGELGYVEWSLVESVEHEDAIGVGEGGAKIRFELGNFLFECLIDHVDLAYIHIIVYLQLHHTFVTVCTIVECVILNFV